MLRGMAKPPMLHQITIGRLELAVQDLLTKRLSALQSYPYGAFVVPELTELQGKIGVLPPAAKEKPFAGELALLDKTHDGYGSASWFLIEAYLRAPDTTPAQRTILESLRDYLGGLDETIATYDAEAKAAQARAAKLPGAEADLKSFPVAGGKTLFDWAKGYVDAGIAIGQKLSARADAKDREAANMLRNETVGVLNEARRQLRRAMKKDAALPKDLEDQIFAWFDDLEKTSAAEAAEAKKKAADPATPPADPVTPPADPATP